VTRNIKDEILLHVPYIYTTVTGREISLVKISKISFETSGYMFVFKGGQ
jgi:hypothetical protein